MPVEILTELKIRDNLQCNCAQDETYKILKQKICSAPVIRNFDATFPIYVTTDASHYAIGAALEQK